MVCIVVMMDDFVVLMCEVHDVITKRCFRGPCIGFCEVTSQGNSLEAFVLIFVRSPIYAAT